MKKLIKVLPIIMTVMMIFMTVSPVFASALAGIDPNGGQTGDTQTLYNFGNSILHIIQIVGSIISVGVLMVLGIKYMMGSAQEKAEYKKTFIPYLVGAVLLFAAVNIAGAVINLIPNS